MFVGCIFFFYHILRSSFGPPTPKVRFREAYCSRILTLPTTLCVHCLDVTMSLIKAQITSVSTVCSAVCSGAYQRKHQSSASLAFVRGIHRWPVDSPHKGSVTRKMFPFDDVIMGSAIHSAAYGCRFSIGVLSCSWHCLLQVDPTFYSQGLCIFFGVF